LDFTLSGPVELAREIRKIDDRIQFVVFGDGDKKKYLETESIEWRKHVPDDDDIQPSSLVCTAKLLP